MMNTPMELILRIPARHAVREAFAGCSTGCKSGSGRIGYYRFKGGAISAFDSALAEYGLHFDPNDCSDLPGDDGWKTLTVCNGGDCFVGYARLSWHRMELSGGYEFTGYLS